MRLSGGVERAVRMATAAAAAVLLVLGLVAAITEGGDRRPADEPQALAAVTGAFERAKAAGSMRITITIVGPSHIYRYEGAYDFAARRGEMERSADPPFDESRWVHRFVDGTMYTSSVGGRGSGPPWLKYDPATLAANPKYADAFYSSPLFGLDVPLGAWPSRARPAGHETLDGDATTRYDVTMEGDALWAALPHEVRVSVWREEGHPMHMRLWVDGKGRLRKATIPLETTDEVDLRRRTVTIVVTVHLFDFGVPVAVEPPPPNQVRDVTEIEGEVQSNPSEVLEYAPRPPG